MSFVINQGFSLKSPQFNFERDYFKDLASLKAAPLSDFPNYFVTNVAGVLYVLDKTDSVDSITGKWRKLVTTEGNKTVVDNALDDNSTNPVQNKVISGQVHALSYEITKRAYKTVATTSADGLLSAADKAKLDGIDAGANKITVDNAMNPNSGNPVANRILVEALSGRASTAVATQSANGLLSAADKKKLDGIASGGTADSAIDNATIDKLFT